MPETTQRTYNKKIQIIGAATGWGARNRRCEDGPDSLRSKGLVRQLQSNGFSVSWAATVRSTNHTEQSPLELTAEFCQRLAAKAFSVISHGALPIVVGGDHSCAIGTWSGIYQAIAKKGPLGLIWIDAHMDSHTLETTPSGALHGMPLACLLGFGDESLTEIGGKAPKLLPEHVCLIGIRSYEEGEAALLQRLGVRVFGMNEIRERGLEAVLRDALQIVQKGTAGFGITIDLDAIDPEEAPGVGTPAIGGLHTAELANALRLVNRTNLLLGIEVAEYNPYLDRNHQTAHLVETLLLNALSSEGKTGEDIIALENQYCAHNYHPLHVVLNRGEGAYVWDDKGNRYLDMMSAYSAVSHGHCHPRLVRVLTEQARTLAVTSRAYYNNRLAAFLEKLCHITGQDMALPTNTGLEAVETALKAARKWGYKIKGIAPDQAEIIACEGNFHGRSIAIVGMSSEPQYRDGFGPYPPGFKLIPYGNAEALEAAISPNTAAFIVEPIQGEAGIMVPPLGYLAQCAEICKRHNVLLICDEVQTGLGRTGKLLACDHDNIKPDGIILGKALGGGLLPVSAFVGRKDVLQVFSPGDHGSTFGGNALAAAVGLEALNVLVEERLVERSSELGSYFLEQLLILDSALIREVRGKGLFIGVEVDVNKITAHQACTQLMHLGILSKDTHEKVLRFAPPLVISKEQLDWAISQIRRVFV